MLGTWKSSLGNAKRPGLDWTQTSQDRKFPSPVFILSRFWKLQDRQKTGLDRFQPVFRPKTLPNYNIYVNAKQNFIVSEIIINIFPARVKIMMGDFLNSSHPFSLPPLSSLSLTSFYTVWDGQQRLLGAIGECRCPSNMET